MNNRYRCQLTIWNSANHQAGAVLLLMLLTMLLSGTSTLLAMNGRVGLTGQGGRIDPAGTQSPAPNDVPVYLRAGRDAKVLQKAKVALLSYAVTYIDNYNPSGAGAGHFPCPDLDPPDDGNPRNDGPNPPCGRAQRQLGRVPRMTTATRDNTLTTTSNASGVHFLPDNRSKVLEFYPLITHLDQQPWYFINDAFINNPLNRQVNLSTRSTFYNSHGREIVALLIAPGAPFMQQGQQRPSIDARDYLEHALVGDSNSSGNVQVSIDHFPHANDLVLPIYIDELMPYVLQRVAGFVRDQLLAFRDEHCPVGAVLETANCFPFAAQVTGEQVAACTDGLHHGQVPVVIGNCNLSLAPSGLLEGVSYERHWFVRNGWQAMIGYRLSPECRVDVEHHCEISIELAANTPTPTPSTIADAETSNTAIRISVVMPG